MRTVQLRARAERLIAKGKVIDPNGQPVAGVAVIIDETKTGTVTDGNGYYVIDVPNVGVHLTFTCLGYKPQTAVVPKSLSLDIYMEEDTLEMDAAVVVGMGHQRKASVIGAISSVSRDALKIPQRNLTNALAGKIAGAVVVQRTGEPGLDNAEFWIRGISSLNSSAPLVLVDGVERSMSDLSIEEIETISVLKDASGDGRLRRTCRQRRRARDHAQGYRPEGDHRREDRERYIEPGEHAQTARRRQLHAPLQRGLRQRILFARADPHGPKPMPIPTSIPMSTGSTSSSRNSPPTRRFRSTYAAVASAPATT